MERGGGIFMKGYLHKHAITFVSVSSHFEHIKTLNWIDRLTDRTCIELLFAAKINLRKQKCLFKI